ncbi:MAG: hypothetical protein ISS65_02575 [Desulfobacterales bacterium]|uniref:Uncharacterized protein n=1 Tax=Candidatus Desulfatibia profunda TaxID=2841695 RepID=A0A8J6NV72_9BACT|nr:hypothetical protein [Candidatus Desulfatibia profunda]MBL7179080.1 hypothetical protein [Desulfobacterales bacterium]
MKWFLYAFSLYWIAIGSCAILYTSAARNVMARMIREVDRRILSIVAFIAGIAFLFAASSSSVPWLIRLFGLMGILKGVYILVAPKNLYDQINDWYLDSFSDQTYRLWGIISLVIGTAVLSWIL